MFFFREMKKYGCPERGSSLGLSNVLMRATWNAHSLFSSTVYPALNLIDYLRKKIPKVVLGKLFEMFGSRLQVTYKIFCRHVAQVGTSVF